MLTVCTSFLTSQNVIHVETRLPDLSDSFSLKHRPTPSLRDEGSSESQIVPIGVLGEPSKISCGVLIEIEENVVHITAPIDA